MPRAAHLPKLFIGGAFELLLPPDTAAAPPAEALDYARKRRQVGAGPVTVHLELSRLSTVLRASRALLGVALTDQAVREARAALRAAVLGGRGRERDRLPTAEELARLRAELPRRSRLPLADMMDFARITAMRREEVCRLRWDDLDAAAGTILIRDRKDPKRKAGNHQRVPLLFGSLAIVPRQPWAGPLIFPVKAETVSTGSPGHAVRAGSRTCAGTICAMPRSPQCSAGMGIEEVALVSGHRSWEMLRRYTHPSAAAVAGRYRGVPEPPKSPDDIEPEPRR